MPTYLTLAFSLLALIGVAVLLFRPAPGQAALERALRAELQTAREEQGRPPGSQVRSRSAFEW